MLFRSLTERGTVIARSTVGKPEKGEDPVVFHDELWRFDNAMREVMKPTDLDDFTQATSHASLNQKTATQGSAQGSKKI